MERRVGGRTQSSADADQALAALCQTYWYPLYAYVRRRVSDVNEAQDLTQSFFAELLEKNYVGPATPERGRFRAYLLVSFKHFLSHEWEKAKAQKAAAVARRFRSTSTRVIRESGSNHATI